MKIASNEVSSIQIDIAQDLTGRFRRRDFGPKIRLIFEFIDRLVLIQIAAPPALDGREVIENERTERVHQHPGNQKQGEVHVNTPDIASVRERHFKKTKGCNGKMAKQKINDAPF